MSTRLTPIAGADQPGVHPLRPDQSSDLAAQACALKYTFTVIDMHGCSDKAETLRRFAAALHFPAWFGHNWDALGDCLTDMSWAPAPGHLVVIQQLDELRTNAPDDWNTLLQVLTEAARSQTACGVPLWFFVESDCARTSHERP